MKILFVDNKEEEYKRFLMLPFAQAYEGEILHIDSPVGLTDIVNSYPDLRLIVLDILWEQDSGSRPLELGADAMRELSRTNADVPVVVYSVINDEAMLRRLIPEMLRLGAYDWISKDEPKLVRSFRFERAFNAGRDRSKAPESRAILPPDQEHRPDVHVAVMFIDMSGFTALSHAIPGEEVVHILREFYSLVGTAVAKHAGYVDKYIGDAVMVVFGASGLPQGREEDLYYVHVQNCIRTAKQIQAHAPSFRHDQVLPVLNRTNLQWEPGRIESIGKFRVGIESGTVEIARFHRGNESEITFIGTPVNIASRILAQGNPGEVWLGQNAHNTGAMHSEIEDEQEVEYKNLPGKYKRYRVRI
jgi:class 3 adenylate cyclase